MELPIEENEKELMEILEDTGAVEINLVDKH
jgi:hypothetical protein